MGLPDGQLTRREKAKLDSQMGQFSKGVQEKNEVIAIPGHVLGEARKECQGGSLPLGMTSLTNVIYLLSFAISHPPAKENKTKTSEEYQTTTCSKLMLLNSFSTLPPRSGSH